MDGKERDGEQLSFHLLGEENGEAPAIVDGDDSAVTGLLLFSVFIAVCGSFAGGCAVRK